ncbi:MAG: CDP-alcohol phosphatidyltransferase family protein [Legionellaceae bacterium]|nr:CDP-alcohol phosphatidyltransferase family protein [Legionellaceae bacterium]
MLRHLPNALTLMRLLLIVPFLLMLYQKHYDRALFLYIVAGLTDGVDGWLARRYRWQSTLGSILDPLADKLLVVTSFMALGLIGVLPWWLVILVLFRDLTITLGVIAWLFWIREKLDFEPSRVSKLNTCVQIALVTLCLFEQVFFFLPPYLITAWIALTASTTTISYVDYVWTFSKKACTAREIRPHE